MPPKKQSANAGFFSRHRNVAIYVPNLIGYLRIAFALYAFAIAFSRPLHCIVFYFLSFVCDELDGRFARMLNQTSTLGAVLDMVTDRCVLRAAAHARMQRCMHGACASDVETVLPTRPHLCLPRLNRLATTGLLMLLAVQYPSMHMACVSLVFLDIFSHW